MELKELLISVCDRYRESKTLNDKYSIQRKIWGIASAFESYGSENGGKDPVLDGKLMAAFHCWLNVNTDYREDNGLTAEDVRQQMKEAMKVNLRVLSEEFMYNMLFEV